MIAPIGHNQPPSALDIAQDPTDALREWMVANPVIETEEKSREAKRLLDRMVEAMREIEAERDKQVRPLNEQVAEINAKYKAAHNTDSKKPGFLDKIVIELKSRLRAFMEAEEAKRLEALRKAQEAAAEAERLAREAEAREKAAQEDAKVGVETDVVQATKEADQAFGDFAKAARIVARAEKDTHVKVAGGFGRSVSFRTTEVLILDDWQKAITEMGMTDKIREAILSSARDYRKAMGELPDGITATTERNI